MKSAHFNLARHVAIAEYHYAYSSKYRIGMQA